MYRTLHSYKLFWAVCHLFPQRWRTLTYSVSGNHWPGGPRDMLKTTSARKFKSCVFEPPTRRVFSINTSSSNTLVLFYQILPNFTKHTPFSVNQQERKATTWMGLADIHIQWRWDAFQSLRNCLFLIIKKDILDTWPFYSLVVLDTHTYTRTHTYTHTIILLVELEIFFMYQCKFYYFSI